MKLYSVGEVEIMTKISRSRIVRLDKSGKFSPHSVTDGGHRRYTYEQVNYLKNNKDNLDFIFNDKEHIELPNDAVKIKDSINHWICPNGNIYAMETRRGRSKRIYIKSQYISKYNGYVYCGISYMINGKKQNKNRRVHRLVAEAFIENDDPKKNNIIGHRNNIKNDNRIENLYWTTISENTQKAVDDGLMVNDKGFDDSQSKPVKMFKTSTNEFICEFGSITMASKETNIDKTTISRQCRYKRPVRKEYYFRFIDDIDCL